MKKALALEDMFLYFCKVENFTQKHISIKEIVKRLNAAEVKRLPRLLLSCEVHFLRLFLISFLSEIAITMRYMHLGF